jgi:hypothetical protein
VDVIFVCVAPASLIIAAHLPRVSLSSCADMLKLQLSTQFLGYIW